MKKVLLAVAMLALTALMLCAAGAEEKGAWVDQYPKAPENRLVYKVPDGIDGNVSVVKQDGYISVNVLASEMSREDWKLVMIDGGYPNVNVQPGVLRPDGYDTCMSFNGAIFDCVADDFFNTFANDLKNNPGIWGNNHERLENGETIGEIVADQCMFLPYGGSGGGGFFICWMNRDRYKALYPLPVEAVWDETAGQYAPLVQDGYTLDEAGNIVDQGGNIVLEAGWSLDGSGTLMDKDGNVVPRHIFTAAEMKANKGGIFYYEYVETAVQMDVQEPFYVPFRSVSAAMMAPTENASIPTGLSVKEIKNGDITYLAKNLTENVNAPVVFDAPDGADYLVVYAPNHGSYKTVREEEWISMSGGRATYYHQVHQDVCVSEEQLAAVWLDTAGNVIDYGIFWFHVETPGYMPGGYYVKNAKLDDQTVTWYAPTKNRVELINNCESTGVDVSYDPASGIFHISYDVVEEVTGEVGWVGIRVKAPEGATAARINQGGGNQIMGPDDNMASSTHHIIVEQSYIETQTVDDDGYITVIDMQPLRHYAAGPVDVYIQSGAVWPYGGGQSVIYWYKDAATADDPATRGQPMLIEYVADTTDVICVTTRTEIVDSEEDITDGPVDNVTCVKPGHGGKGWHLVVRRYPQRGKNACHWELYLENECGDYEPLDGETVIYMPYPKGHKYVESKGCAFDNDGKGNKCSYEIYHYNSGYTECEPLVGEHTPYGIKFKVSSLSPFVLDWGDFQGELAPDQGEDDNNDHDNNKTFNLQTLMLNRGRTTINGGCIRQVQLFTGAQAQINDGRFESISIDFGGEPSLQQSTMNGGAAEMLMLIINENTPAAIGTPVLTVGKEAAIGVVLVVISENEPPESGITGQMIDFAADVLPGLVIEGDLGRFNPAWLGDVSFEWVQVQGMDEPMDYDTFLNMIQK